VTPMSSPRGSRNGRVALLVLCLVILALLLLMLWTRPEAPAVERSARSAGAARIPRVRAGLVQPTPSVRPETSTTQTLATGTPTETGPTPSAAPASMGRATRVGAASGSPDLASQASVSRLVPATSSSTATTTAATTATTTATPTAANTSGTRAAAPDPVIAASSVSVPTVPIVPSDFVVLAAGDEELAPVSVLASAAGPMIPLSEFAALIGATVSTANGETTLELRADEPVTTTFSTLSRRGQRKQQGRVQPIALAADDLTLRNGELFASVSALETLSGLALSYDTRSQSIVITSPRASLPRYATAVRRSQRAMQRPVDDQLMTQAARPATGVKVHGASALPSMASLTYALSHDNANQRWSSQGTIGAAVLGGGLSITGALSNGPQRKTSPDITWLGGNPLSRWLTQARVGFGAATGLAPLPGVGVSLTNAPFARAMGLGTIAVNGFAAPGAEIEIQSGGRVLGLVTADDEGRWQSSVPVGFGQNLLEVSAYSPLGVTRRTMLRSLEGEHLPAGRVEYGVTAQHGRRDAATCAAVSCGDLANLDLRWGVSPRLTLRAGASALAPVDSAGQSEYASLQSSLYGTVVAAPLSWLQLRQEIAGTGWRRSRAIVQPSLALRADLGQERLSGDSERLPFWQARRALNIRDESWAAITWRPFSADLGRLWLSATGRSVSGTRADTRIASALVGARARGTLVTIGADHTRITPVSIGSSYDRARFSTSVTIPQLRRGPRWLATSFTTLGASVVPAESRRPFVNAGWTTTAFGTLLMQVGADWRPGAAPGIRLQFQQQTRAAILTQSLSRSDIGGGPISASTTVLGSVVMPLQGGAPQFTSDLVALRSRVRVIAFLDRDGNGLRDASEAALPDLPVMIGTQRSVTDARGIAVVDGLPVLDAIAIRPLDLSVGQGNGETWVLRGPAPWARLIAYGETVIYLPYVAATQVTMTIRASEPSSAIWLTPLDDPEQAPQPKPVFGDGISMLGALPPGRYRLDARRAGESATDRPWASCTIDVKSGAELRLRFPSAALENARCDVW
jgi:hypothetical protein